VTRLLLRGGCVLTLGTKTPNLPTGDVLVDGDRIAEVGANVRARDAETIDASNTIVMPGFVDTHRHLWRSLFRNLGGDAADVTGERFTPEDVYAATLVGLAGAAEAAITTVVDWADGPRDDPSVEAALQAHADSGLRTVLVQVGRPMTLQTMVRLRGLAGPTTTFAFGTEGAAGAGAGAGDVVTTWSAARDTGVRIHAHALGSQAVSTLGSQGEIRDDVTFVHGGGLDDAALGAIASGGASISLTPSSEMAGGAGAPPIQELLDHDLKPALGVDDERIGPGDLFAQMRATISLQHATVFDRKLIGKAGLPRLMTTRDVIRSATVEGARAAGQQGVTGSLEPGMQADLIVLRTDRPNVFPINDPIGAVVWGMDTSNVDLVIAGGRVLVRGGRLEADVARVRALATAARERVLGVTVGAVSGGAS
jgi:5-methylthioadenosine/S-adenosylhomocysteine deaminase